MPDGRLFSLHYELKVLDELVLDKMNPERDPMDNIDSLMGFESVAKAQKELIKKKLVCTAYSLSDERITITYIHNHQASLSHLIEVLFNYSNDEKLKKYTEYQIVINQIINHLVDLMIFLAETFRNYFNYDAESTISFKGTASAHFRGQLMKFHPRNSCKFQTILDIALEPIIEFTTNPLVKSTTFRKLMYFDNLIKSLLLIYDSEIFDPQKIKILLIELNFNSNHFFWYIINEIELEILSFSGDTEKIEKLSWYLKQVNQIQMRKDLIFEPKQESIKEKIINWLLEEICFLEKSIKKEFLEIRNEEKYGSFKLTTNLSVPVYGLLLHLLFECDVYERHQLAQSLRFFANHTKTKNVNEIAEESLRQKYYKHEQSVKDKVKALIIKMLKKLNEDFD